MIDILRRRPLLAALAVLTVALAVLLVLEVNEVSRPQIPSEASKPATPPDAKLLPAATRLAAEQAYPETVTRPLFIPTRRPAPPVPTAAAAPQFVRGQFQLLGVIMAGNTKIAMLREKSTGKIHRVAQGGDVNGVKVATIERDTVTLSQSGETESVPMQVQKLAAAGAPAHDAGPFAGAEAHAGQPGAPPAPGAPGAPPAPPTPQGAPLTGTTAALLGVAPPGAPGAPGSPQPVAPSPTGVQPGIVPPSLSPEELLARSRARRGQTTQ